MLPKYILHIINLIILFFFWGKFSKKHAGDWVRTNNGWFVLAYHPIVKEFLGFIYFFLYAQVIGKKNYDTVASFKGIIL